MNSIRSIKELNKRELEYAVSTTASWHNDYRDTAFIYIGGLPFQLSEGDVVAMFSQYGEPDYINLVRDRDTGKSKGFCFLRYEDQRSCDLAVDNLGGATIMGRLLSVDHTRYKPKDDEKIFDNTRGDAAKEDDDDGETASEAEEPERPLLKEERELQKLKLDHDDDDPMKAYLIEQKQEEVRDAVERYDRAQRKSSTSKSKEHRHRHRRHHRHRSERDGDEHTSSRRSARSRSRSPHARDSEARERERRRRRDRSRSREGRSRRDSR